MFEKFYPQIKKHTVNGVVRKVVASVEEKRPYPIQHKDTSQQNEKQPQIGTSQSLVDDDFQHQRHQKSETGTEDMEDNTYAKHLPVGKNELVQLFKTAQIFVTHKKDSVMKLSIKKANCSFFFCVKILYFR
jgi:hypothetical protein